MRKTVVLMAAAALAVAGCAGQTPVQRHEVGCMAGTVSGAVVGGLLGSLVGGGTGQVLATAAGAGVGGYAGNRLACE